MLTINKCWDFLEKNAIGEGTLPAGASEAAIKKAEAAMKVQFPDDFRKLLLRHDGSGDFFVSPYKIGGGGQTFLSLKQIVDTWKFMVKIGREFDEAGEDSEQKGPIKHTYYSKLWIPFTENGCGDNIFIDLDPPEDGTLGQVVDWWHEGGVSTFQATSLKEWLNEVVEEIKAGAYQFGTTHLK